MRALVTVAAAALAVAAAGCGGDDDAASDAAPPDARPEIEYDAGPPLEGTTAWELVTCGVEMFDAGPDFDAGPLADAGSGAPDGLGDPCCDPEGGCNSGLECISSTDNADESGTCRPVCADNNTCPHGGRCATFGGQKICINASEEGQECAPELCADDTICVGDSAETATCHRICQDVGECEDGETCDAITGSDKKACMPG